MKKNDLNLLIWIIIGGILLFSLALRWLYVWVTPMEFDEGHWLMFGVLVNAGHPAYTETFVGIPPLALLTIQLGEAMFGYASLALRYPMMLYSLVGIASIFVIFITWRNPAGLIAGAFAALFLSADIDAFRGSGTIMAEVPAVSMAVLSFALAWQFYYRRHWFLLLLSGVAFTLSIALKIFVVFLPAVIAVLTVFAALHHADSRSWRAIVKQLSGWGVVWSLGALIPLTIFLMMYDPAAMYKQVYLFRLAVRDVYLSNGLENISIFGNFFQIGQMMLHRSPLVIGTLVGVVLGWKQRRVDVVTWLTWLCLAILLMTSHAPLRTRYSVLLLPPLAALSGLGLAALLAAVSQWLSQKWSVRCARVMTGLMTGGIALLTLITPLRLAWAAPAPDTFADDMRLERLDALNFTRSVTTPTDCLITDDQRFSFRTDRLVPPAMSETSKALLLSGWLTADDIIREVKSKDCVMVVYALGRFNDFLPDLRQQLRDLFYLEIQFTGNTAIYTVRKEVASTPSIPIATKFGEAIILEGVDILPSPAWPGHELSLAAYWRAAKSVGQPYKISLQLRNSRDEVVATLDHFPFPPPAHSYGDKYQILPSLNPDQYSAADVAIYPQLGMLPTNIWPVGKTLREVTTFYLPTDLPPGTYYIFMGMYDPDTQERLPVQTETGESNELMVSQFEVTNAD